MTPRHIIKLFALSVLMLTASLTTYAQKDILSTKPIFKRAQYFVDYLENELHQEIVRVEVDILVKQKVTFRDLQAGQNYKIIAFSDDRISDIDIMIYRYDEATSEYVLVKKDEDNSDMSLVPLTPTRTGEYKFEISAYAFKPGYNVGHYGLIICHD